MAGIGKYLAGSAAAAAIACGSLLIVPTDAAAQFNIEGLIRGAIEHGCCYGGGYRYRGAPSRHAKTQTGHSKDGDSDQGETSDRSKEKDATQVETGANGTHPQQQPSGPTRDASRSVESDAPVKPSSPKAYDDQPAFSPAR